MISWLTMVFLFLQVESVTNKDSLLEACHSLRVERERQKDLANQKQDESIALQQVQQRATRLGQQLRELRQSSLGATPQGKVISKS